MTTQPITLSPAERRRALAAGTIGNVVEWFDWAMYAFFTPFIAATFFAGDDAATGVLKAVAIYAVGFFFRPLGGAVLGSYADRHGRKSGMALTIGLMAASSLAIAIIPGTAAIGIAAPVLLVLARCLQGFSAGGEFGASSAFMVENARSGRRATIGALQQVSVGAGTLLAALLSILMSRFIDPAVLSGGAWRFAFVIGAVMGLIGLYMRARISDTMPFLDTRRRDAVSRRPMWEALRSHPGAVVRVIGMLAAGTGLAQLWLVMLPTFAAQYVGAPMEIGRPAALVALLVFTVLVVPMGWLSDRIGRRPVLVGFAALSAVATPLTLLWMQPTAVGVMLPAVVMGVLIAAYGGSLAAVMSEQFPTEVRTAGISLPYGLAVAFFGGLTPLLAQAVASPSQIWILIAVLVGMCLLSALTFWFMRDNHRDEIHNPAD